MVEEELPEIEKGKKGSKYDLIIDDFLENNAKIVRVDYPGINPKILSAGLRHRIRNRKIEEAKVKRRG